MFAASSLLRSVVSEESMKGFSAECRRVDQSYAVAPKLF